MAYIRTAPAYGSSLIFIQRERDNKISKESFCSVYPGSCGMYFSHKNNDFAVTLSDGRFIPPPQGWRGTIYYPLYDESEDGNEDEDENEDYDDENDDENEYSNDKNEYDDAEYQYDVGAKSAQKEDVNQLYYDLLKNDNVDDVDKDDLYSDDEW